MSRRQAEIGIRRCSAISGSVVESGYCLLYNTATSFHVNECFLCGNPSTLSLFVRLYKEHFCGFIASFVGFTSLT